MQLHEVVPQFIYPTSRQFPVDEVCELIVRELEKRNWNVPGIEVDFDTYGAGQLKYKMVRNITGRDFKLRFGRIQGSLTHRWNDTAAVTQLTVMQNDISIYDDESGPRYCHYIGDNWEQDREWWVQGYKMSYERSDPRFTLYAGSIYTNRRASYSKRRSPFLVLESNHTNAKPYYHTAEVLDAVRAWLETNVLEYIKSQPEQPATNEMQVFMPFPKDLIGPIYYFPTQRELHQVQTAQENIEDLEPDSRYSIYGGYRLLSLGIPDDGTFPKIAYDGFAWCGVGDPRTMKDEDFSRRARESNMSYESAEGTIFIVKPKFAEGIFVIDLAPAEAYQSRFFRRRKELTNNEHQEFRRKLARTLVPITEYKGGYKKPMVLINREMDIDEVEIYKLPTSEAVFE